MNLDRCTVCGQEQRDGGTYENGVVENGVFLGGTYYHTECYHARRAAKREAYEEAARLVNHKGRTNLKGDAIFACGYGSACDDLEKDLRAKAKEFT